MKFKVGNKVNLRHGFSRTPTYSVWSSMVQRCFNPKCLAFRNYGGRGIVVCDEWKKFDGFLKDMGKCPDGMTLERIDSNGNYGPTNCRWASWADQGNNTSRNRLVTMNGETLTVSRFAKKHNVSYAAIWKRLRRGVPVEIALVKIRERSRRKALNYEKGTP